MPTEKEYCITVQLTFDNLVTAPSKKKAIKGAKDSMLRAYNIEVVDKEIISIEEIVPNSKEGS